jgi:hypothetical protein
MRCQARGIACARAALRGAFGTVGFPLLWTGLNLIYRNSNGAKLTSRKPWEREERWRA